jgi:sucrose-6-phosphate hydrolase SacC (GH32 family)
LSAAAASAYLAARAAFRVRVVPPAAAMVQQLLLLVLVHAGGALSLTIPTGARSGLLKTDDSVDGSAPRVPAPAGGAPYPDSHVQCSSDWQKNRWPTFHLLNNVTRRPGGALDMETLNDANAIFPYRGLWHVMFQSGDGPPPYGWRWAHKVSSDLVHWYPIADALTPNMTTNTTWDDKGACDGTLSFPDLGNGSTPIVLYGPDCGVSVPFDVAVPTDTQDPYLTDWVNRDQPRHVTFDGIECQFPGRVWRSKVGAYWNMLCSLGAKGTGHWARFTSSDRSLMHWKYSNKTFIEGAVAGGFSQGPLFHRIPNAPPSGPTHLINSGKGDVYLLGNYDETREVMVADQSHPTQRLDCSTGDNYNWVTTGPNGPDPATDSGRLLIVAWIYGPPAPSSMSLIREISWDVAARQLISFPVPELTKLRTKAIMQNVSLGDVGVGALKTLPLGAGTGGSADVLLSFVVTNADAVGFGVAVRAPANEYAGVAAVTMTVDRIGAPDASGSRNISLSFVTPDPKVNHDSNANATVLVLRGETLDVRVLIDKSVVEFFVMGGRAAYVACDEFYHPSNSSVHVFNTGPVPVAVPSANAYSMGCGWAHSLPVPSN